MNEQMFLFTTAICFFFLLIQLDIITGSSDLPSIVKKNGKKSVEFLSTPVIPTSSTAAIPKSKRGRGYFAPNSFVSSLVRKAKASFSSEMEALTLQLTQPNSDAVAIVLLSQLIEFIDVYYTDSELIASLLIKLSRKFQELNIFTQLKSSFTIHYAFEKINSPAKKEWCKLLFALRSEIDERFGQYYFTLDLLLESINKSTTVVELASIEYGRLYLQYILEYLNYQRKYVVNASDVDAVASDQVEKAARIIKLLELNMKCQSYCAEKLDIPLPSPENNAFNSKKSAKKQKSELPVPPQKTPTPLIFHQTLELIIRNQQSLLTDLKEIYEDHAINDFDELDTMHKTISLYEPSYSKRRRVSNAPPIVSKANLPSSVPKEKQTAKKAVPVKPESSTSKAEMEVKPSPSSVKDQATAKGASSKASSISSSSSKEKKNDQVKTDWKSVEKQIEAEKTRKFLPSSPYQDSSFSSGNKKKAGGSKDVKAQSIQKNSKEEEYDIASTKPIPSILERSVRRSIEKPMSPSSSPQEKTAVTPAIEKKIQQQPAKPSTSPSSKQTVPPKDTLKQQDQKLEQMKNSCNTKTTKNNTKTSSGKKYSEEKNTQPKKSDNSRRRK